MCGKQKISDSPSIRILSVIAQENKIVAKIKVSPEIARFVLEDTFIAEYDTNIENSPESILAIPVLSTLLPVAWAVGADIHMGEVDETYLCAMEEVKSQLRKWYPQLSYSTRIHAREIVRNQFDNSGHGILFSSGMDSLFSCARHRSKNPILISICGGDIPYYAAGFWAKVKDWILKFASDQGLSIRFIRSNMREIINRELIQNKFGITNWWGNVSHSMILIGLCAPLTIEEIGSITIAASHTHDFDHPWGSHPLLDPKISWSDVKIVHDGYDFSRQDKIRYLSARWPIYLKYLRVCYFQHMAYNCGRCEKCLRTITGLLLENQNPKDCNFEVDDDILHFIRKCFSKRKLSLGASDIFMWQDIQKHIPSAVQNGEYDQKNFFAWLKGFDLTNYHKNRLAAAIFLVTYLLRSKNMSDWARHGHRKMRRVLKGWATAFRK